MDAEEWPDRTLSEVEEDDDVDISADDLEQTERDLQEATTASVILGGIIALGRMLADDYITIQEYIRLTEYLAEWESNLDNSPLR